MQDFLNSRIALETQSSGHDGAGNNFDGVSSLLCFAVVSIHPAAQFAQTSPAGPAPRQFPDHQPVNWRKAASMIEGPYPLFLRDRRLTQ